MDVTVIAQLNEGFPEGDPSVYEGYLDQATVERITAEPAYPRQAISRSYDDSGKLTGFLVTFSNLTDAEQADYDGGSIGPEDIVDHHLQGAQFTCEHPGCGHLAYDVTYTRTKIA